MSAQYLLLLDSLLARLAYMLNTGLTCGKGSAHKFLVKSVKRPKMEVCRCSYGLQRLILLQCNYHFADGAVKGALPMLERGITDLSDDPTISCLESFTLHTFRRPEHGNIQYADQWASVYWWTGLPSVEVWQWSVVASTALSNVAAERDVLGLRLHCSSDKQTICSQTRFCVSWLLSAGIWWAIARSLIYFRYNFFSLLCSDITSCHLGTICSC